MTIPMKDIQFPQVSYAQWKEQATRALKGKSFDSLFTSTIEGLNLEPLYTEEMLGNLDVQLEKQMSTIRSLKGMEGFNVAQQIYGDTASQFFSRLQDSIDKGNQVLTIDSRVPFKWDCETIGTLADYLSRHPFKMTVAHSNDPLLSVFNKITNPDITGYIISSQPIAIKGFNNVKTASANTVPYHHDGAHAIQELALALAMASKYADQEPDFERFLTNFFVNFAIDTQFFSEIAKLRAFKILWKAFTNAYGVQTPKAIPIMAETSLRSFSKLDVYVNLLRAGNEAFAALIGGADIFTVHPHDCLSKPTEQSIRIARNVSLVLKEESYVDKILDPSGGSYFIETLTAQYAEKAWKLFLEIEEFGGLDAYITSGQLQTVLDEVRERRLKDIRTRKHSLIGTNIYANPADTLPAEANELFSEFKRLAVPFENLRKDYQNANLKIEIMTYGSFKDFKERVDFLLGFFAVAGIIPECSREIQSPEELRQWVMKTTADYVVIAAKDEDANWIVPAILQYKPETLLVDAAGKFPLQQKEWMANGLNGFIFQGQDIVEKLTAIIESLRGVQR